MARPIKNNADYFSHDAGMRNHKKVKAIRSKFGISGYAVWSMLLEYLTGGDGNVFPYTDLEFELMSGDFGIPATEIRGVVDYCINIELLFNKDGFINSDSLDERLAPVYEKRRVAKELSKQQQRTNGQFSKNNAGSNGQSVTEIPQSIVKESKEGVFPSVLIASDEKYWETICIHYRHLKPKEILEKWEGWYVNKFEWRKKELAEMRLSFESWLKDPHQRKTGNKNPGKVQ